MRFASILIIAGLWGQSGMALQKWEPSDELRREIEIAQASHNLGPSLCFNPYNPFSKSYLQEGEFDLEADAEVLRAAGATDVLFEKGPCVSQIVARGDGFEFARGYSTMDGRTRGYQVYVTDEDFEGDLPSFE